jgi:hypothetical protein
LYFGGKLMATKERNICHPFPAPYMLVQTKPGEIKKKKKTVLA